MKERGFKGGELHAVGFNQCGEEIIAEIWECPFCKKPSTFKVGNVLYIDNFYNCDHAEKAIREEDGIYFVKE